MPDIPVPNVETVKSAGPPARCMMCCQCGGFLGKDGDTIRPASRPEFTRPNSIAETIAWANQFSAAEQDAIMSFKDVPRTEKLAARLGWTVDSTKGLEKGDHMCPDCTPKPRQFEERGAILPASIFQFIS